MAGLVHKIIFSGEGGGAVFLAICGGDVPSTFQILTLDQYL